MNKRSVTFLPKGVKVTVEENTTILAAAAQADVEIKAPCGGDGTCGKCVVILKEGQAKTNEESSAAVKMKEKGFHLACQTLVGDEDLTVEVPVFSAMSKHQVMVEDEIFVGKNVSEPLRNYLLEVWQLKTLFKEKREKENFLKNYRLNPLYRWVKLTMTPPNLQDNRDDLSRLLLTLKKETNCKDINPDIPLSTIRNLGEILRKENFKVSVLFYETLGIGRILGIVPGHKQEPVYGLAVDIGTTTVVVYLLDLVTGTVVDSAGTYNRQARYGDDVISRIIYATEEPGGLKRINQAVTDTINNLTQEILVRHRKIHEDDIRILLAAGNTTMAHLFLGINPKYIRLEPYIPTANYFPRVRAEELGIRLHPDAPALNFPAVASYVGGDIVAGALYTGMNKSDSPISLLIDIGTNGEMVLGSGDWLLTCSCSAGPAFEGSGITFGMRAMQGAIERLEIDPVTFEVAYATINNTEPVGICGSGLIDCIAKLRRARIIDRAGKFHTDIKTDRIRQGDTGWEFVLVWQEETAINRDIIICEADIKNLLRAKGAVFAGIRALLKTVDFEMENIEIIYVAGGFGNYLNIPDAIAIGLLPDLPAEKYRFIGNSSVKGACLALLSREAWKEANELAGKMTYIELSVGNLFMEEFISSLFIPHTDLSLFPNVKI